MKRTLARFSKVLLLLGVWVAAVGAISIAHADCAPSPSGLVSWWRAEGNATDAAGGNNGVLLNDATFGTGKAGQGFSFDGINDLVKIPKAANLDVGNQVTIEFWMKASPGNAMNTYQGLVTSDFFGIEIANGYVLGPLGVEFFISTDGGASVSPSSYPDTATVNGGGAQVSAGVWHHVAGTYDGTKLQLYIDGQPWGVPNYHTGAISPMLTNSFVAIGAEDGRTICPDCVNSRYFNGQIDEPAIYNRALSAAEILNIYTAGSAGKCTPGATNNCVAPPSGMVGWWKADGNVSDVVGGNNGVLQNAGYTNGIVGQAFHFDPYSLAYGTYSGAQFSDQPAYVLTNSLSIEAWARPQGDGYFIFFRGDHRPGLDPYYLCMQASSTVRFGITDASGNPAYVETTLPYHQWTHVAGTLNGSSGTMSIYTNGTLATQLTTAVRPFGNLIASESPGVGIGNLNEGGNNFPYAGDIDEVALFNRALTAGEVLAIYHAGSAGKCAPVTTNNCIPPPAGLAGWWPGDGNTTDAVGGGSATLQSGALFAPGKVGQGFRFDGTNGYAQIPDSAALKPANVSCEAWVWLDPSLPVGRGGEQIVFKKNTWSAWFEGYSLLKISVDNGNGTSSDRFQFCVSRFGNQVIINSQTIAQRGVWYHVAATYDGNQSKLYVNGVLEATATPGFALDYDTTPIFIGTSGTWAPYLSMFGGIIDEPTIYNRALSVSELAAIYTAGSAGKCSPNGNNNNAPVWLNVDFGAGAGPSAKTGRAAVGQGGGDFWNYFTRDDGVGGWRTFGALTGLKLADGTVSTIGLTVANAPGAWGNGSTDSMLDGYIYPFDGGNVTVTITNLPAGQYEVFPYSLNGKYEVTSGGANYGVQSCYGFPVVNPPAWTAGVQFTHFTNVVVTAGQPLVVIVHPTATDVALISGLQIVSSSAITNPPDCTPAPSGLAAWWPGNGNTSELIQSLNGTLAGGATYTNAIVGQGFNFDGVSGRVTVPNSPSLNFGPGQDLSIECWIKAFPNSNPSNVRSIVEKRNGAENYRGYTLFLWDGFLALQLSQIDVGINYFSFGADLRDGVFHHVAATVQRNSNTGGHLYVDGQLIYTFDPTGVSGDLSNADVLRLGQHAAPGDPSYFPGVIDDVAIYRRALSTAEIQSIYNAGSAGKCAPVIAGNNCVTPPPGIVSWWRAESNAVDTVNGNNGMLANGAGFAAGEAGTAFVFDGVNGHVDIPASASLNVGTNGGLTFETWVRPSSIAMQVVSEWNNGSGGVGSHLWLSVDHTVAGDGVGNIYANLYDTTETTHYLLTPANVMTANEWQHLAVTYDRTSGVGTLYRNGVVVASQNLGVFTPQTSYDLHLGYRASSSFFGTYFGGLMDEPSLYNRALSQSEVQSIYAAGSAGKCSPSSSGGVPVISNLTPASAAPGASVIISGNYFSAVPAENIVYFGAVRAQVLAASPTSLTVSVPVGATYAPVTVTVNGRTGYSGASFLVTFAGLAAINASSFAPRVDLPTGPGTDRVVIGDLDGDGKPDMVAVNVYDATIWVYRNISTNGALTGASFAPGLVLQAPGGVVSYQMGLVLADLDGDGRLDIVAGNGAFSSASVFQNLSSPGSLTLNSFAARIDLPTGNNPNHLAVRDLDGDGRPEIVTANVTDNTVSVLRNLASPGTLTTNSFAAPVGFATGSGPTAVAIADLDGDHRPDLVTANGSSAGSAVSVLRNLSTVGNIAFAPRVDFAGPDQSIFITTGDLDGDGKQDLVVAAYANGQVLSVYRNTSAPGGLDAGSFAARVDFATGAWSHTASIGDLDGDGKPDVAVASELPSQLSIFKNTSTPGSFTAGSFAARVDFATGYNAWSATIGDLDGDGRPDIALGNAYDATLSIYRNLIPIAGIPVLQTQPADQTVTVGNPATFTALATGSSSLAYQWRFNGTNISGATNTSLTLLNVQLNQAGNYSVLVSNAVNYAASSNALLTVNPAACVPPPAGLVSWWRAESNALDSVTGNHGMLQNGAGFADGKAGSAFAFDGVDDYVLVNPTASLNVGLSSGFTVEAWINPTTTDVQMPIIEYENALGTFNGSDVGVHFYISVPGEGTGPGGFYANLQDTAGNGHFITSPAGLVAAGVWQHVALTYDQTSGNATVYLNGVMVAQASLGSFTPQTSFPNLLIGARTTFGSAANPSDKFSGGLDDLSIYDRALAPAEITAIYNASSAGKCDVPVAPTIVVQPQNAAALAGTTATFNVAAAGNAPLAYQWFFAAAALTGETNSTLTLNNIVYPMNGSLYSVRVTNIAGSVTSRDAVLNVLNTPPQISNPGSQIVDYIAPPLGLPFTVSDAESAADNLQIFVDSSNTNLVPNAQVVVSGTGTNRLVTPTAITNLVGSTTITLTVVDEGGLSNQVSFGFTVINSSPSISAIAAQRAPLNGGVGPIAFTVSDAETPADQLVVAATTSNNNIVPTNQIVLGGAGANRTVTVLPGTNAPGTANVTITVTDGLGATTSRIFSVTWDAFTEITPALPALQYSALAWGDYDNDGKLDLLVSGTTNGLQSGAVTRVYHNDGGVFTNFISLPGLFKCALAWSDYDRDGRLDFAISGLNSTNQPFSRIYHNNGNGTFTDLNAGLTGCYAGSVAWGDFNSDGAPDLFLCGLVTTTNVTTAVSTNILRLYRNDGGGVFTDMNLDLRTTDNRAAGPNNGTAAWGDYDNDGRPDLLLVGPLNGITSVGYIYRNLGNGNFTNITVNSFGGLISSAAAWGDYDNDGWLDFAVFNSNGATSAVYHNNRNNTFTVAASFAGASGPQIAWGDYNNDGYLDLLVGNGRSIAKLYRNNGNGTFTDTLTTALSSTFDGALAWGDFDNDGDLDAVFCGSSNSALLRNNSGTTNSPPATPFDLFSTPGLTNSVVLTWQPPVDSQTKSNGLNYNLRVGTTPGGIDIVSPLADPTNGQRRVAAIGNVGPTNRAVLINLPKGTYYWSVQAIDTAFAGSPFFQLPGGVDRTFTIINSLPVISDIPNITIAPGTIAPGPVLPFTISDFETFARGGDLSITVRSSNTNVVALTNIVFGGSGSNRTVQVAARTNGISVITVTVTDANAAFASDNFTVTAEQFSLQSSNFIQVQNSLVAWGDYNNDGRLDVLIAGNTNTNIQILPVTQLYRNDGNGVFTPVASGLPNVTFGSVAWADYNNDGWLDLIVTGTTNNSVSGAISKIYRNNGDGTFTDSNVGLPRLMFSAVVWGDYDNDGRLDLLLSGTTNGVLSGAITRIYRNNGNGTFSNAVSLAGIYLGSVSWADFDGDGDLDVVIAGQATSAVPTALVYRNNGNGTFTPAATLTGFLSCSLAVADFNNDGLPDILLTGYNGSYLSLLYRNAGNFSFIQTQTTLPGARYASVAAGDYDNDGKPDILISGTTTGLATSGMARVYRNTTTLATAIQFSLIPTTLPTNYLGAVTWADFNNDGRLDVMITGVPFTLLTSGQPSQTALYRNNNYVTNTPPTAPTALSYVRSNTLVSLAWAKSSDAQTTNANGLKYQIRVGTNSGGLQIESPLADLNTGFRRVVRTGDASTNRWQLQNLPPGTYYWSVQAIDTAFAGSPFATEATFTISHPPVANPDAITTASNTPVAFAAAKLALNDTDPDGDPITVIGVSATSVAGGTVTFISGQVTYTPPSGFTGNDAFTYTISDGQGRTAAGTVTATVGSGGGAALNLVFGPVMDGSDFVVRFAGIPGLTYTIEAASDLSGPWAKVANLTAPTYDQGFGVGIFEFREPMNANTTRFYRTVYPSY